MTNSEHLRPFLTLMHPYVEPFRRYEWSGFTEEQSFQFLRRAIVVRQYESLEALQVLIDNKQGHFGVTLLRPAYEEFIWLTYLETIPAHAPRIVRLMGALGVSRAICKQADYLGTQTASEIGFPPTSVKFHKSAESKALDEMKKIGKILKWDKTPPTFRWLSRKVDKDDDYQYIYFATSNFVHFSPHELLRRVWGNFGTVTIDSGNFASFWVDFATYWLISTFIQTAIIGDIMPDVGKESHAEIEALLKALIPIQIITDLEVMRWKEAPQPIHK